MVYFILEPVTAALRPAGRIYHIDTNHVLCWAWSCGCSVMDDTCEINTINN